MGLFGKKRRRRSGKGFSMREMQQILMMKTFLGPSHPATIMYALRAVGGRM